jgi:hypothetical protein
MGWLFEQRRRGPEWRSGWGRRLLAGGRNFWWNRWYFGFRWYHIGWRDVRFRRCHIKRRRFQFWWCHVQRRRLKFRRS